MQISTVLGGIAVIYTGVSQSRVSHTNSQVHPTGNVTASTDRRCVKVSSVSFQVPPVSKYTGNAEGSRLQMVGTIRVSVLSLLLGR